MKKIQWVSPNTAQITEVDIPKCEKGQVLLKVKCVGVCGSDMQVFAGRNQYMKFPVTPFHEGVLEIVEVGDKNSKLKPGTTALVWPFISCNDCYSCNNGRENACMNFTCLGIQADGFGAEYYLTQERFVYPIEDGISLDKAILIEPLSVGVHAATRGDVENKNVLIIGGGTIGNMTAQACKLKGAKKVCVCDISQEKIDLALKSGVDAVNTKEKTIKEAAQIVFGTFPDVIMDCSGVGPMVLQALEMVGKTTVVVLVANYSTPVELNLNLIQRNELDVRGCIGSHPEDFAFAAKAICEDKLYCEGFISAKYHYTQVQEMMEYALANRGVNIKVVMEW